MKKYINILYKSILTIICLVLAFLQIQAHTLITTDVIIRLVILFLAYGFGLSRNFNKKI